MDKIFVKPGIYEKTGNQFMVRHPVTFQRIPPHGVAVPGDDIHVQRRLKDGGLVKTTEDAVKKGNAEAAKAAEAKAQKEADEQKALAAKRKGAKEAGKTAEEEGTKKAAATKGGHGGPAGAGNVGGSSQGGPTK